MVPIHFAGVSVLLGAGARVLLIEMPPLLRRTPAQPRALLEVHTGQYVESKDTFGLVFFGRGIFAYNDTTGYLLKELPCS